MNRYSLKAVLLTALILAGCGQKPSPAEISALSGEADEQNRIASGDYDAEGNYIGPGSQTDLQRSAGSDRVFFGFDSFALDNEDRETLRRQAEWLARFPEVSIVIEGHCDERGTRDYNIALRERRANAAKNYLAALGVSPGRMTVVSYGKERPAATGSDESAWSQNRRAVSIVVRPS